MPMQNWKLLGDLSSRFGIGIPSTYLSLPSKTLLVLSKHAKTRIRRKLYDSGA